MISPSPMPHKSKSVHDNQRGHALLLVLVAVVLFGGLSYVVSQSGKKASEEEKVLMAAAQVTQFPAAIRTAVARLVAGGVQLQDIDFNEQGTLPTSIFYSGGGAIAYQKPPADLGTAANWRFKSVEADNTGWFVGGIGSDGPEGKDVFAYLVNIPVVLCQEINRALGLPAEPLIEPSEVNLAEPATPDAEAGNNVWTFSAHSRDNRMETPPAACVRNGGEGPLVYYHVLAAQ
jgi:hypothetical protein